MTKRLCFELLYDVETNIININLKSIFLSALSITTYLKQGTS